MKDDLKYAARRLAAKPGFAIAAILLLGLGLGANTAIFSLIDALLYRALPVPHAENLVRIGARDANGMTTAIAGPLVKALRKEPLLDGVCGLQTPLLTAEWNGTPQPVGMLALSGDCYRTLGLHAALGRLLTPADDTPGAPHVAILSYGFWQQEFASNPRVLGRQIRIEGVSFTIVGVTERGFRGLLVGYPLGISYPISSRFRGTGPVFYWADVLARLRPGVTPQQLQNRLAVEWRTLIEQTLPPSFRGAERAQLLAQPVVVASGAGGIDYSLRNRFRGPLAGLLAISVLVLLGACLNLANLMLARGFEQRREIAVRLALGAVRWRIVSQLVIETALLLACGIACAAMIAWAADRILLDILSGAYRGLSLDITPDARILTFTSAIALATLLLFGVIPAWQISDVDSGSALKTASRSVSAPRSRNRRILISAQVALTLILVMAGGLFVETLRHLENDSLGFETRGVLNAQLMFLSGKGLNSRAAIIYSHELLDSMATLPGVEAVSLSSFSPLYTVTFQEEIRRRDLPDSAVLVQDECVSDGFFKTMRVPLLAGRGFRLDDSPDSQKKAVISEALANKLFPGGGALGRHVQLGANPATRDLEIVGIAQNTRLQDPRTNNLSYLYLDLWQFPQTGDDLQLRYSGSTSELISAVRKQLEKAGHQYALQVHTLSEQHDRALLQEKLLAGLGSCFAVLALALAAVGLFGLLSFSVASRTGEFGIRMALGALRRDIISLVLREAVILVSAGLLIGAPLCFVASRAASALLYGIAPVPLLTFAFSAIAVCAAAALAASLPVYRAISVEPASALKYE